MALSLLGNLDCAKSVKMFILSQWVILLKEHLSNLQIINICPKFCLQALFLPENIRWNLPSEECSAALQTLSLISKKRAKGKMTALKYEKLA